VGFCKVNDVGIASLKDLLSFEGVAKFICALSRPQMLEGVHCYLLDLSLLSWKALLDHDVATFDYFMKISYNTQNTKGRFDDSYVPL
jgi:hypothetical protein